MSLYPALSDKKILLIISGGIAAYKSLDLIRRLKDSGASIQTILTKSGAEFVTPLSVSALSGHKCYMDLFSLTDETEMGHINLSRENDLILIAPASANILARFVHGFATDLASTCLLASNKPVAVAPAMNPEMWANPATQSNVTTLKDRGVTVIGPDKGLMACGEEGWGRLSPIDDILETLDQFFTEPSMPLKGKKFLVTAGPTHEPIDPVRYIANRSSGKQGIAIAEALAHAGAEVDLILGPVTCPPPTQTKIHVKHVETAAEMLAASLEALPVDGAICAAAVCDWAPQTCADQKMKKDKTAKQASPTLKLSENPDILASLSQHPHQRPELVIGFAAETEQMLEHARAKLTRKKCDWILANDVSEGSGTFGGDENQIHLFKGRETQPTSLPKMKKSDLATWLVAEISTTFNTKEL